ncbi:MAG: PKD domain-containing protein [Marinoscillum sp.]
MHKSFVVLLLIISSVQLFGVNQPESNIYFVENKGQWNSSIYFGANIPGGNLFITKKGLQYYFQNEEFDALIHGDPSDELKGTGYQVEFQDVSQKLRLDGKRLRPEMYNFYIGKDSLKWGVGCRAYGEVVLEGIYEGIDMVLYSQNGTLKYDLNVGAKASIGSVKFKYTGDVSVFLEGGCSFLTSGETSIIENRPIAFQIDKRGNKRTVDCQYELNGNEISFEMGPGYHSNERLIIDPELVFSTFSGSTRDNFGFTSCYDDSGRFYSGGIVFGPGLQRANNSFAGGVDMAIHLYDSTGSSLIYSTYIGGSSTDVPISTIVNSRNELVIFGVSGSDDYPVTSGAYDTSFNGGDTITIPGGSYAKGSDIVITRLGPDGEFLTSSYVGGSENDGILKYQAIGTINNELVYNYGDYYRGEVILDQADNVYIASNTFSKDFPLVNALQNAYAGGNSDGVVFSLNSDLSSMRWSTFLGGTKDDAAYAIRVNSGEDVIVTGGTDSDDFPVTSGTIKETYSGGIDGFVTTISQNDFLIKYGTYVGTEDYDQSYLLDLDEDDNVYLFGQTTGSYPITGTVYSNSNSAQFIHKLTPELDQTIFSTVFGSGQKIPNISPNAFTVTDCGSIFISGWGGIVNINFGEGAVGSTNGMPITGDAYQQSTDGSDFYLMVLSENAKDLLYATYFGSNRQTNGDHVDGGTSRFDKSGVIYQSVCSCGGLNDNFPTTENAWSRTNGNQRCNNVAFKFDLATLRAGYKTSIVANNSSGQLVGCAPLSVTFTNKSSGGDEFHWDFGDGTFSNESESVVHTFETPGVYEVSLNIFDADACPTEDTFTQDIFVYDDEVSVVESFRICQFESVQLFAEGGVSYLWDPAVDLNDFTSATPLAFPQISRFYTVYITTPNGCVLERSVDVLVDKQVVEDFSVSPQFECGGDLSYLIENNTEFTGAFYWDFGDGTTSTEQNPVHQYETEGAYTINLEISDSECIEDKRVRVDYREIKMPNAFTPNGDGKNDFFEVVSPLNVKLTVLDRSGAIVYADDHYNNDWDGDGLESGTYYYHLEFGNQEQCASWLQIMR